VINNTAINNSAGGRFINIGKAARGVIVFNNLYAAPKLETGADHTANVYLEDDNMNGVQFRNNLWSNPFKRRWGNGWHYFWGSWSDERGYYNVERWAACENVKDECYRTFTGDD